MQRGACMVCIANVILRRQSLVKALLMGFAGLLTVSVPLAAETGGSAVATTQAVDAPCGSAQHRAFDFWLGDWRVQLADGTFAGENRIQASDDGCFFTERWRGAGGSTGFSMNFYEPSSARWRQIWVSAGAIIEISGSLQDGSMVLVGEIHYRQAPAGAAGTGPVRPFRGSWTPLPDGRVRQFFEELISDNLDVESGEENWQPWFEGFYAKALE